MFSEAAAAASLNPGSGARPAALLCERYRSITAEIISKLNFMVHYLPLRHWSNGILNGTDLICVGLASQLRCYLVLIIR